MFDMIRFFGEEFENVYCDRGITVKRRQRIDSDEWADVTTDDWANVICRLKSGISADVRISRSVSTEKDSIEFYVIGSNGALRFIYSCGKQKLLRCVGEEVKTNIFRELEIPEEYKTGGQSRSFIDLLKGTPDQYAAAISEGIYSQAAVDAAKLSSQTGRAVAISELFGESAK